MIFLIQKTTSFRYNNTYSKFSKVQMTSTLKKSLNTFEILLGVYTISIRESPVLEFSAVPEYSLSISCSDQKDSVTETIGLYVTENKSPEVTNLPGILEGFF